MKFLSAFAFRLLKPHSRHLTSPDEHLQRDSQLDLTDRVIRMG